MPSTENIQNLKKNIAKSNMNPIAKERIIAYIKSLEVVGRAVSVAGNVPISDREKFVDGVVEKIGANKQEDIVNMAKKNAMVNSMRRSIEAVTKKQEADPASAAISTDRKTALLHQAMLGKSPEGSQKYIEAVEAKKKNLGLTTQGVLPKNEVSKMVDEFNSISDSEARATELDKLQAQFGKHTPKVIDDLIREDKDLAYLHIASQVDGVSAKKAIMNNNSPKAMKEMNDFYKGDKDTKNLIDQSVRDISLDLDRAINLSRDDGSTIGFSSEIKKQVTLETKRLQQFGANDSDIEKNAKQAYQKIVGSTYNVVDSGRGGLLVPKTVNIREKNPKTGKVIDKITPIEADAVKEYADTYVKKSSLKEETFQVPGNFKADFGDDAQNRYRDVIAKRGRWVNTSDQTGMALVIDTPDGYQAIKDVSGEPIKMRFEDVVRPEAQEKIIRTNIGESKAVTDKLKLEGL